MHGAVEPGRHIYKDDDEDARLFFRSREDAERERDEIRKELEYLTKFLGFEDLKGYLACIPEKLRNEDSWDAIIGLNDYINNGKPK